MKKAIVLFALIIISLFPVYNFSGISPPSSPRLVCVVYAQTSNETGTNQTILSHALQFSHPCYQPAKIIINFPYTHNAAVTQITTIGPSMYDTEGTPTSLTFNALDVDVYTFRVTVNYDNATDRTVTISLWSGTQSMEGYTWTEASQVFIVDFRIEVSQQPHYPTKDEVAEEVFNLNAQLLINLTQKYEAVMRDIQSANFTNSIMTAVSISLVIVALFFMGFSLRKRRIHGAD